MRQIQDAFDVTGFVAEENSGPTDKNGKRSVLKLEFSIIIEKEHNPNPGSERKKKKHKRAVQGGKGAGDGIRPAEWRRAKRRSQAFCDEEQRREDDKEEAYQSVAFPW